VTKSIDPVGSLDLRHAEALAGFLAQIQKMVDAAVAAALLQSRDQQQPNEPEVLKLTEFCKRNNMGKSKWHELVRTGHAPEYMRYGKEYRITKKAEAEWRTTMAKHAKSAEVQLEHERRREMAREAGKKAGKSELHVCRRPSKGRRKGARA
jgi:hypothetical protein